MGKPSKVTIEHISEVVIDRYIATGEDSTAQEIAEAIGCSRGTIDRRIREAHGFMPGCRSATEMRTTYSKSFRSFSHGAAAVAVYGPTRETMRGIIVGEREERIRDEKRRRNEEYVDQRVARAEAREAEEQNS